MVKEWYKKQGFKANPLHTEARFNDPFLGYDVLLKDIEYRIDSGSIIFVDGKLGKTALLMKIIDKFKGKGKVAYVNCEKVKDEPNIKRLLANGKRSILNQVVPMKRDMIILMDNVNYLSADNTEKIKYYFDEGYIKSIVLTAQNYLQSHIPQSLRHRIGRRVYSLKDLTNDEITAIICERLDNSDFFPEELIRKVVSKSKGLIEAMDICNSALMIMSNEDYSRMNEEIVDRVLEEKEKNGMVS
jgi:Cdc6-like AAA superfamily ATPase